jgi:hypothetical protein
MKPRTLTDTSHEQSERRPPVRRESLAEAADRLREEARRKDARALEAATSEPQEAAPRPTHS